MTVLIERTRAKSCGRMSNLNTRSLFPPTHSNDQKVDLSESRLIVQAFNQSPALHNTVLFSGCCFLAISMFTYTRYIRIKRLNFTTSGSTQLYMKQSVINSILCSPSCLSLRMCYRAAVSSSSLDRVLIRHS